MELSKNYIFGNYKLISKIGSGAFSEIFLVIHTKTDDRFAAKIEPLSNKHQLLTYEAKLLRYLHHVLKFHYKTFYHQKGLEIVEADPKP